MGIYFVFILKSAVCMSLFYLLYKLLLSRETFYSANRYFLLAMVSLSFILPFIHFSVSEAPVLSKPIVEIESLILVGMAVDDVPEASSFTLTDLIIVLYLAGTLISLIHFLLGMLRLGWLLLCLPVSKVGEDYVDYPAAKLIVHNKNMSPFSWMNRIVISSDDLQKNGKEILLHEYGHVKRRHSLDLLFIDILLIVQWFNPTLWLIRNELQEIHEYEADEFVLSAGVDARHYQLLLIKKAVGSRLYSITNSFNHSNNLKKRITMMLKKRSNRWAMTKYAVVLPLAVVTVTAFARPEVKETERIISEVKVNDLFTKIETPVRDVSPTLEVETPDVTIVQQQKKKSSPTFMVVEEMPEFPGGMAECVKFIGSNVKYPKDAQDKKLEGRVIVQFDVDTDGSIDSAKVVRKVTPSLDEEALRVIRLMPKWKPGRQRGQVVRVRFTLPISFSLAKKEVQTAEDKVFVVVEQMPEYPGGMAACMQFIAKNLRWPKELSDTIVGRVIVSFTVERDGTIAHPEVVRSIDPLLDAEAVRVIMSMPKWKAGMQRGVAVPVKFTLPIIFDTQREHMTD